MNSRTPIPKTHHSWSVHNGQRWRIQGLTSRHCRQYQSNPPDIALPRNSTHGLSSQISVVWNVADVDVCSSTMSETRALKWMGSSGQKHELNAQGACLGNYRNFMNRLEASLNMITYRVRVSVSWPLIGSRTVRSSTPFWSPMLTNIVGWLLLMLASSMSAIQIAEGGDVNAWRIDKWR